MRTTVEFDAEAARAIEQLRRERGLGVSQAVNELVRRGLLPRPTERRFRQRTAQLGLRVDVSNVAEGLAGAGAERAVSHRLAVAVADAGSCSVS